MPKVTEAHLEARRSQILDAAWTCFARKGYHQATMQDICQESGLSPGAIYRYFESKEAILKAINERSQEMGRAVVEEARALAGTPLDTLQVIGRTMMAPFYDPMFETTARVNIEVWPEIIRSHELRDSFRRELTFWKQAITDLLSAADELGQLKPGVNPESLTTLLICAWEGIRHYSLIDREAFRPERLIEVMQALVVSDSKLDLEEYKRSLAEGQTALGLPFQTPQPRRRGNGGE